MKILIIIVTSACKKEFVEYSTNKLATPLCKVLNPNFEINTVKNYENKSNLAMFQKVAWPIIDKKIFKYRRIFLRAES